MKLPSEMNHIEIREAGGPEVLVPVRGPVPEAGEGEVLVKVAVAGVNRPDVIQRSGGYPPPPGASPIPGLEVSGEIVALGRGSGRFKVGDRVRVRNLPDVFYTRCQVYTRGAVGTVTELVYESPAAEDEAWDNTDKPEWFYSVVFRQKELWPEYPDLYAEDTLESEFSERWLEPA